MEGCDVNKTLDEALEKNYTRLSWTMYLIFSPLVTAFGVIANSAFIFVVHRIKTMRTITNIFLVNLVVADSSLLIAAFAQYIGSYVNSPVYNFGFSFNNVFGCVTPNFLIYLCYYKSLWTVTLISVERYFGVCHLLWYRYMGSTRRAVNMVLASWLISALFASPTMLHAMVQKICIIFQEGSEIMERIPKCFRDCDNCNIALYATDLIEFVIALIVNIVLYGFVVRKVTKTRIPNGDIRLRKDVKKVVHSRRNSIATIAFFVCLIPFTIVNINNLFGYYFGWFEWNKTIVTSLVWIGRVFFLLNSTLNPLIYNATNPIYRLAFKQAFNSRYSRRSSTISIGSRKTPQGYSVTKTLQWNFAFDEDNSKLWHTWTLFKQIIVSKICWY